MVQKKTVENDGYDAVQLGYRGRSRPQAQQAPEGPPGQGRRHRVKKYAQASSSLTTRPTQNLGDVITVESFEPGDKIDVTGVSKGKGYAGTIKRFNGSLTARPTAAAPCTVMPVPWAPAPTPSRIMPGQEDARSARKRAGHRSRISTWSRLTPRTTCSSSRAPCPGPKGGTADLVKYSSQGLNVKRKEETKMPKVSVV